MSVEIENAQGPVRGRAVTSECAITKLSIGIVAPRPHRSIRLQHEIMRSRKITSGWFALSDP